MSVARRQGSLGPDPCVNPRGPGRGPARFSKIVIAVACVILSAVLGCGPTSRPDPETVLQLRIRQSTFEDPRTFSVGRVQLRALDERNEVLAAQITPIDRATGVIDVPFAVPAGSDRRILLEPLGSAILPDGSRTESAIALQGFSGLLDIVAGTTIELELEVFPFIPDSLRIEIGPGRRPLLVWRPMPIAESHVVRVFVRRDDRVTQRLVPLPAVGRVALEDLAAAGVILGLQVRSVNRFASSAFSDTLFLR